MKKLPLLLWLVFAININFGIHVYMEFNDLQEFLFIVWLLVLLALSLAVTLSKWE